MIKQLIKRFFKWIKYWMWDKPVSSPPKEEPVRVKGEQVFDDYVVIEYQGQKVNLHKERELPIWNKYGRDEKRATALGFKNKEKKGLIRFEMINGKWICLKNKNYGEKADIR